LHAWELYQRHPEAVAAECHTLLYLQMSCEKLCKAHLIRRGSAPAALQASHGYIAKPLPVVIKHEISFRKKKRTGMAWLISHVAHLSQEIELLNPSIQRAGHRPDNCEYPWELGGKVLSPLDHSFALSKLLIAPAGRTFLKLLRSAIERNL
jgi:hypothetical protein